MNRHNLFGYRGLLNKVDEKGVDAIVDRFYGETVTDDGVASSTDHLKFTTKTNPDGTVSKSIENLTPNEFVEQKNKNINVKIDELDNLSEKFYSIYSRNNLNGEELEKGRLNPTAENIVNFFKKEYHAVEYDYTDFAYCKYYGQIPNNHLITLRRFPYPVHDNIYDINMNKYHDMGRMVTWFSEETGNKLSEILKME
jgi:hypothetical protein